MSKPAATDDAWSTGPPLDAVLRTEPYRFEFFQAVRILERLFQHSVGTDANPEDEVVRFRAHQSLLFPPSEIYGIVEQPDGRLSMTVAFMGLTGPSGALPRHYTELVIDRLRHKDRTLRDFLDLFNHRLIALFYRAWQKNRFWIGYEHADMIRRSVTGTILPSTARSSPKSGLAETCFPNVCWTCRGWARRRYDTARRYAPNFGPAPLWPI